MIDVIFLIILGMIFMTSMSISDILSGGGVMMNVISILYELTEAFLGATFGKMILGIQIANESGEKDTSLYFKRYLLKNSPLIFGTIMLMLNITTLVTVTAILSFTFIVGCFLALGENKQALHDILLKTAVFKKADVIDKITQ